MCWSVSFSIFLVTLVISMSLLLFSQGMLWVGCVSLINSNNFVFDNVSFYLVFLVLLLGIYSLVYLGNSLGNNEIFYLALSLMFSIFCFCTSHSVLFWCFYELSMLPLLYLIFSGSPYSERFLAGWYFSGYLLITSLPLLLLILYLSIINESFNFIDWDAHGGLYYLYVVLSFIFFTKVPLVPFHTWLPIVHAEATSVVSIYLSGYIMKLGLLGVYRCTYFIFNVEFVYYLLICCVASIFFILVSSTELDGKRWLAMLSLAHIIVPLFGIFISDWNGVNFSFLYCLGHGVSAGLVFGLLWYFYGVANTRNWLLLKSSINSNNSVLTLIVGILSLCSFPTSIQFFCEVGLVSLSYMSVSYLIFWACYLFLGGLVPLILCGHLLIRSEWYDSSNCDYYTYCYFVFSVGFWCFCGMFLI